MARCDDVTKDDLAARLAWLWLHWSQGPPFKCSTCGKSFEKWDDGAYHAICHRYEVPV